MSRLAHKVIGLTQIGHEAGLEPEPDAASKLMNVKVKSEKALEGDVDLPLKIHQPQGSLRGCMMHHVVKAYGKAAAKRRPRWARGRWSFRDTLPSR